MEKRLIIAIDGYSSCGKSTFARAIASELNYIYIDSGAMYRAVTLYSLRKGYTGDGEQKTGSIIEDLPSIHISFIYNPDIGAYETYLNSENVEDEIRSIEVSSHVSRISQIHEVRDRMVELQKQIGVYKGIVMDGRDIGTVVLPMAKAKIFLTASAEERAERRYKQLKDKGVSVTIDGLLREILARDARDASRAVAPLRPADDAVRIEVSADGDVREALFYAFADARLPLLELKPKTASLEDVFLDLTDDDDAVAAKAVALKEALSEEFRDYQQQIIDNAQALAAKLLEAGFDLVSGGTDNHLMLVDVRKQNLTGKQAEKILDHIGVTVNKNAIPNDPRTPFVTSGVRIGTPAVTSRGFKESEMEEIARLIYLAAADFKAKSQEIKNRVADLCEKYPLYQ